MEKWHQYTQGNKSVKEYVEKFDEFLIRCSTLHKIREVGLKDDLRTELLTKRVNELEAAYVLI